MFFCVLHTKMGPLMEVAEQLGVHSETQLLQVRVHFVFYIATEKTKKASVCAAAAIIV